MCKHEYVYMYVYIYLYIYMNGYVCTYIYIYLYVDMYAVMICINYGYAAIPCNRIDLGKLTTSQSSLTGTMVNVSGKHPQIALFHIIELR